MDTFKGIETITYLNLSYNALKQIKSNTFKYLKSLLTLSIDHNQIETIDVNSFVNQNNLISLYLNNNKIMIIFSGFLYGFLGSSLNQINLASNQIEMI